MGKTADRLRKLHLSRDTRKHDGPTVALLNLIRWHCGDNAQGVGLEELSQLTTAIVLAASAEARRHTGDETRKMSLAAIRAMRRLPDDELIAVLHTCDMATFGRIQTAHTELHYERNGIPVLEIPGAGLSNGDWFAACNGDGDAYTRVVDALNVATVATEADNSAMLPPSIELPTALNMQRLPMGMAGLRDAITNAMAAAEQEINTAGNKEAPHMRELATACRLFMRQCPPAPNRPMRRDDEARLTEWRRQHGLPPIELLSPAVSFTKDVFELAGMGEIKESRVEELLAKRPPKRHRESSN